MLFYYDSRGKAHRLNMFVREKLITRTIGIGKLAGWAGWQGGLAGRAGWAGWLGGPASYKYLYVLNASDIVFTEFKFVKISSGNKVRL